MTNFQLYLLGWLKMWYVLAIFVALVVTTYFVERGDKLEKKKIPKNKKRTGTMGSDDTKHVV